MSLKFRNSQGIETPVAGLNGTSGELVPSVALYQRGTITNTATITSKSYERIEVTLSTPMPDADYVVDLQTMQGNGLANAFCDTYGKTTNGFAIILANPSDNDVPASQIQVDWRAFKLMTDTVHEADSAHISQNTANFAPAFSEVTSYAVGDYVTYNNVLYRCTTAHTAGAWVAGHFTQVTVGENLSSLEKLKAYTSVSNTDADTLTTTGLYYLTTGCTNVPSNYCILQVQSKNTTVTGDDIAQYAINTEGNQYSRVRVNGTWSTWRKLATSDDMTSLLKNKMSCYTWGTDKTLKAVFYEITDRGILSDVTDAVGKRIIARYGNVLINRITQVNGVKNLYWDDTLVLSCSWNDDTTKLTDVLEIFVGTTNWEQFATTDNLTNITLSDYQLSVGGDNYAWFDLGTSTSLSNSQAFLLYEITYGRVDGGQSKILVSCSGTMADANYIKIINLNDAQTSALEKFKLDSNKHLWLGLQSYCYARVKVCGRWTGMGSKTTVEPTGIDLSIRKLVTENDLAIKKIDISAAGGSTSFSTTIPLSMAQRNKPFYLEVLSVGNNNAIKEMKYLVFVSSMDTTVTTKEISKDSVFTNVSITFDASTGYELNFSSTDGLYTTTVYIQQ